MPVAINNGTDMIATIKDIRPSPMWRDTRRGHSITRVQAYSRFHGKMLECCPLSTGPRASRRFEPVRLNYPLKKFNPMCVPGRQNVLYLMAH
jgi:hypothetical protein